MKLKISKLALAEGEKIPLCYGFAYYDFPRNEVVCYPIPLNLIVRVLRLIYFKLMWNTPTKREQELHKSFNNGYIKGVEAENKRWLDNLERHLQELNKRR